MENTQYTALGKAMKKSGHKDGSLLNRRTGKQRAVFTVVFVILMIYAVSLILPSLWMVVNSFKKITEYDIDIMMSDTLRFPDKWMISNYWEVFPRIVYNGVKFPSMLLNSFYYIIVEGVLQMLFVSATGYVLSKYKFKARGVIYSIAIFAMTIPVMGNMAAGLKLRADLGLYDNLAAPFFTAGAGAWGFEFLMTYAFFKAVSWDYAEAVFIDGGGHYTVFFRIMLPMAMPILTTLFILRSIGGWNDYMTPLLYFPSYPNIATGLYGASEALKRGAMSQYYAALVLTTLPVLVLFVAFADKIMKNYTIGGLKG